MPLGRTEFMTVELDVKVAAIAKKHIAQAEKRESLREGVRGIIEACSTLKQAQERLPEFVDYLPLDRSNQAMANTPAIANVVGELVKAGWPDQKKEKAKK